MQSLLIYIRKVLPMTERVRYLSIIIVFLSMIFLTLAGCQAAIEDTAQSLPTLAGATNTPATPGEETTPPRATPYAQSPAAGICGEPTSEDTVLVEIWPDIPSPRCLVVRGDQYLRVVNRTDEVLTISLGRLTGSALPGEAITLELPFDQYLETGVHVVLATPFGGPEIWLKVP
jgi:hypothetical protein